jgi:GntR family transcriptional regulator/MocR family aminotransferase
MTLPVERRLALLDWADRERAWIVEDDYDCEFHHRGLPPPALKSLDRTGRVLYAGSFSKVLFPGLRLGHLILPSPVVERFARIASAVLPAPPSWFRNQWSSSYRRVISRVTLAECERFTPSVARRSRPR